MRESNKKYNDLLQEKLNSEDALNSRFEADKKALLADAEKRIREAVEATQKEERAKARDALESQRAEL